MSDKKVAASGTNGVEGGIEGWDARACKKRWQHLEQSESRVFENDVEVVSFLVIILKKRI